MSAVNADSGHRWLRRGRDITPHMSSVAWRNGPGTVKAGRSDDKPAPGAPSPRSDPHRSEFFQQRPSRPLDRPGFQVQRSLKKNQTSAVTCPPKRDNSSRVLRLGSTVASSHQRLPHQRFRPSQKSVIAAPACRAAIAHRNVSDHQVSDHWVRCRRRGFQGISPVLLSLGCVPETAPLQLASTTNITMGEVRPGCIRAGRRSYSGRPGGAIVFDRRPGKGQPDGYLNG